jgi:hypothetical protein
MFVVSENSWTIVGFEIANGQSLGQYFGKHFGKADRSGLADS